jgi:hypothetical protein
MSVRIEITRVANDNPHGSYLVTSSAGLGIGGVLFPCLMLTASDEHEALAVGGALLVMLPKLSADSPCAVPRTEAATIKTNT